MLTLPSKSVRWQAQTRRKKGGREKAKESIQIAKIRDFRQIHGTIKRSKIAVRYWFFKVSIV